MIRLMLALAWLLSPQAAARALVPSGAPVGYADQGAAARAHIPAGVIAVQLGGYAAPGDGGQAQYRLSVSEPTHLGKFRSADGRWWALAEPVVTLEMFGGRADGTTDNLAAFNAAIGYFTYANGLSPGVGGRILLRGSTTGANCYAVSAPIDLSGKHGLQVVGSGPLQSCVTYKGEGAFPLFTAASPVAAPTTRVAIRNLALSCAGKDVPNAYGIRWAYVDSGEISNNLFLGCNRGIDVTGAWQVRIDRNRWDGLGPQQNGTCLWMNLPTDDADGFGNNAVVATHNICQNHAAYGLRAMHGTGSIFAGNQWMGGVHGVYACDSGSPKWPCQFMLWDGDQVDSTSQDGWVFRLGAAPNMFHIGVKGAIWTGNTVGAAWSIDGGSDLDIDIGNTVTTDIGLRVRNTARSNFRGTLKDYNRKSTGAPGISVSGSSDNTFRIHTSTATRPIGYNGYVEDAASSRNSLYGLGEAACALSLRFRGADAGLATSAADCTYEVNGRNVRAQFLITLRSKGSSTGVASLAGLPFSSKPQAGGAAFGAISPILGAAGMAGLSFGMPYAQVVPGSTTANLGQQGPTGVGNLTDANFTNASTITGAIEYTKQ